MAVEAKEQESQEQEYDPEMIEAYEEMGVDLPNDIKPKKEEEQPEESEEEPSEEKPKEEVAEPVKEEELEEPEKEEEPEEEPEEEEEESKEEPNAEEKDEEELIRDIAVNEKLTEDEAKEVFKARANIREKYKNDPLEMAKALQHTQSGYDKLKSENERLKSQPSVDKIDQLIKNAEGQAAQYVKDNRDDLIGKYKEKYPAKTENMSDEAIIEDMTDQITAKYKSFAESKKSEIKDSAVKLRDEMLEGLEGDDRQFIPEVKTILAETADIDVLDKSFDIQDIVVYARGKKYTNEFIDELKKEYFKKGKEDAKIIGSKAPVKDKKGNIVKVKTTELTPTQANRAQEMFPDDTSEDAIAMYKDTYKEELKKDPKFVG